MSNGEPTAVPTTSRPAAEGLMLDVSHVSKAYGRSVALRDVSFHVRKGSKTLLLGPNGAGKSTMVKTIMGILKFNGRISVDGFDVVKEGSKARDRIGYVPQFSAFYEDLTVDQEARLVATIKGARTETARERLDAVGLGKVRRKAIHSLSGGMRQRFSVAMALLTEPPFLIFDEPLASIDLRGQLSFLELVKRLSSKGTTFLIATHLAGLGDFADDAVVLHRGMIVAEGTPADLLARIGADETLFLKPKAGMERAVAELVESQHGKVVSAGGVVMVVAVPPSSKLALLKGLFADGDLVEDVSMEPTKIESSYTKLLQSKVARVDGN